MKLTESQLHKFTNDAVLAHIRNLIEFKGSFTEDDIEPIIRERAIAYGIDLEDEDYMLPATYMINTTRSVIGILHLNQKMNSSGIDIAIT